MGLKREVGGRNIVNSLKVVEMEEERRSIKESFDLLNDLENK
jgi:hypothetical protein